MAHGRGLRAWGTAGVLAACLSIEPGPAFAQQDLVFRLESFLLELGYNPGTVDNTPDANTNQAIAAYQRDRGLPVTGGMSLEEYRALEHEIAQRRADATTPQPAAPVQTTTPTNETETVYHRLAGCSGVPGLMLYNYKRSIDSPIFYEISDVCWHEDRLFLESSEPQGDLTLVRQEGNWKQYEVLSSAALDYQRTSVSITGSTDAELDFGGEFSLNIDLRPGSGHRAQRHGAANFGGSGFLRASQFPPSIAKELFEVFVSISTDLPNRKAAGICLEGEYGESTGEPGWVTLKGQLDLRAPTPVALVAAGETTGRAEGTMTLAFSDAGDIAGTLQVYFENPRIAGHGPCEWLRAEVTLDTIIGSTVGRSGYEIRAIGVGTGRYTDVNGNTFRLIARSSIGGYPLSLSSD